ncbi:MAG: hypothetical protein LIO86_15380 [Lachnospiraceae bacterium]|nr:hypothetical protein [Lachnospiraceae bacterium]
MALKTHGITTETIKKMILNAGVIYKNLTYADGAWSGTVLGATSGGIKFNWEAEWLDIEVDGATVLVKGVSKQKVGESSYIEGNMTEVTEDILVTAMHLVKSESTDSNYTKYISKSNITEDDDYLENIAYVGTMSSGQNIIIILPNAICTEAFEIETKNATQTTYKVKFECTADLANDTLDKLDIALYYPVTTTT